MKTNKILVLLATLFVVAGFNSKACQGNVAGHWW